jgi:UDP-N-acetylmuramoyl-L-alanyl-D-glutamate--2,6-diaminopimelate ligase
MAADLAQIVDALRAEGLLVSAPTTLPAITGVTTDTRALARGMLFCAVRGVSDDGHEYLLQAGEAGAAAALVEEPIAATLPQVVVRHSRGAAATAAATWFGRPGDALRLLGVTGTNGKGSTVAILRHLRSAVEPTGAMGTLGAEAPDGRAIRSEAGRLTTPGPVGLHETLASLRSTGARAVAMEVSSHALTQERVAGLHFAAAIYTNLTQDHLDYHRAMADYFAAKARLIEHLSPDGILVLNADDPAWAQLPRAGRVVTYAIEAVADVRAGALALTAQGSAFRLRTTAGDAAATLPLLGRFNVENALAAAACAIGLGQSVDAVAALLASAPQVLGRMERLAERPCPVLRDYAHTEDALRRVLETLRPVTGGRIILVFGAGGDRDRGKRAPMGAVAAQLADVRIVTTDNPRTEDPHQTMHDLQAGMGDVACTAIEDREEAIAHALALAGGEDLVLLAGKGHETYQIVGSEKHPFDERAIVQRLTGVGA